MQTIHSEFYLHIIIVAKYADALLALPSRAPGLQACVANEIKTAGHRPLAIGGAPDHLHVAVMMHPFQSIEALVNIIRDKSAAYLNAGTLAGRGFEWQDDYAAFTIGRAQVAETTGYILRQEAVHAAETFAEECCRLFRANGIEWEGDAPFVMPAQRG